MNKSAKMNIQIHENAWARWSLALGRVFLGFIFLWAFLDKTFGLNYTTKPANSWLNGGSPTKGFLSHTTGTFASTFQALAGNPVVDALFMIGLLGIGLALILGIGLRIAAVSGALLMVMMYLAGTVGVAGTNNPVVDDHLVYAAFLGVLAATSAGNTLGLGKYWGNLAIVKKYPFLN